MFLMSSITYFLLIFVGLVAKGSAQGIIQLGQHHHCYKTLAGHPIYFPMSVDEKWSSPPDALTAEAKFIVSTKGVENVFTSVYYLGLVPGKCPEAFKFSNGPTSFDEIRGSFKIYLGYKQTYITQYIFYIKQTSIASLISILDVFKFARLFLKFERNGQEVIKQGQKAPASLMEAYIRQGHRNKHHICIMANYKKFVTSVMLNQYTTHLPEFSSVYGVVYYGQNTGPAHFQEFAAWACAAPTIKSQTQCTFAVPPGKSPRTEFVIHPKIQEARPHSFQDVFVTQMKGFTLPHTQLRNVVADAELNKEKTLYIVKTTTLSYASCYKSDGKYYVTMGEYHDQHGRVITLFDVLKYEYAAVQNQYKYQELVPVVPPQRCDHAPFYGWSQGSRKLD